MASWNNYEDKGTMDTDRRVTSIKATLHKSVRSINHSLFLLNLKAGFWRALKGLDYYRTIEYPVTLAFLNLNKKHRVLDIGSLDSLFPVYLAAESAEAYAVDISRRVGVISKISNAYSIDNLNVLIADGKKIPFPDDFFDRITAISMVEHVLPIDNGDLKIMKEIIRVLKAGGKAIISVPYERCFSQEWRNHPDHGAFLRRGYSETALRTRLVKTTGCSSQLFYFCDDAHFWKIWYTLLVFLLSPISVIFGNYFLKLRNVPLHAKGAIIIIRKVKQR